MLLKSEVGDRSRFISVVMESVRRRRGNVKLECVLPKDLV
jgi:hypothetical protein